MLASQSSRHPFLSASSAPSVVLSSLLWDRQGLSRFSFVRNCDSEFLFPTHTSNRSRMCSPCSAGTSPLSPFAWARHRSSCLCSPLVFVWEARRQTWLFASLLTTSSSTASSRKCSLVFLCASFLLLSSKLQASWWVSDSSPCISWSSSSAGFTERSSSLCVRHVWTGSGRAGRSVAGGISGVVDFGFGGVSTNPRRFSSDQLDSAPFADTQLCHLSGPHVRLWGALVEPHVEFPLVDQLRCEMPRSVSHFWEVSKHRFTKLQQLSAIWSTHRTVDR